MYYLWIRKEGGRKKEERERGSEEGEGRKRRRKRERKRKKNISSLVIHIVVYHSS